MEDFFGNYTNQNVSQNDNMTDTLTEDSRFVLTVETYIIFSIGMLLTLMAIYSAYLTVRSDPVAAIYVINLIIADLIQLCCTFIAEVSSAPMAYILEVYFVAMLASIGFTVSLSVER
ncbi:G-protein coupled receptor 4-like isoform X2 [Xyrichtys novacula]|uniref:G-protein coupled receptor 4-like isoform X2 n=1 Tax=Xyrichtys novacula TaxID=13765 RepID=A0AAV1G0A9_XYRNO|nr:G-protein coupled receptor 4-like isoform X2 [Xyrichtys novacula]